MEKTLYFVFVNSFEIGSVLQLRPLNTKYVLLNIENIDKNFKGLGYYINFDQSDKSTLSASQL